MSTEQDVRRLAVQLPEVSERPSYGTPAFYVSGEIFARMHEDPEVLICWRADLGERDALLQEAPDTFFTTDHYRDHASVLVRLPLIDTRALGQLLHEAWEARCPRRLRPLTRDDPPMMEEN